MRSTWKVLGAAASLVLLPQMVAADTIEDQMKLMQQRMMESVPKADVVITNPTHYSVALKYERGKQGAPEVVAKWLDDLALRIREIAKEHDVPLMEDPPLARALHRAVDVGQQIPAKFYQAVATVLSHVYGMKDKERVA